MTTAATPTRPVNPYHLDDATRAALLEHAARMRAALAVKREQRQKLLAQGWLEAA